MFQIQNLKGDKTKTTGDLFDGDKLAGSFKLEYIGRLYNSVSGYDEYYKLVVDADIARGGVEILMQDYFWFDGQHYFCHSVNVMRDANDSDTFVVIPHISSNY